MTLCENTGTNTLRKTTYIRVREYFTERMIYSRSKRALDREKNTQGNYSILGEKYGGK